MLPQARTVRRLSVRAPSDDLAARGSALLHDALHTATLPGDSSPSCFVIRRLALGRIPANASPASLALLLEHVAVDLASRAVPYDDSRAATAEAVRFPDRGAALIALATLHSGRLPAGAWFWDALVPGWQGASPRSRFRLLLDSASNEPDAGVLVPAIVARAVAAQCERELFESVREVDAGRWLTAAGWPAVPEQSVSRADTESLSRWASTACYMAHGWTTDDIRVLWLATALAVHDNPSRAADPRLPARIAALLRRGLPRSRDERSRSTSADQVARQDDPSMRDAGPVKRGPQRDRRIAREGLHDVAESESSAEPLIDRDLTELAPAAIDRALPEWSAVAGLLFVVPILVRCGFVEHLRASPVLLEERFPERLLGYIARRCGVAEDDPLARVFPFERGQNEHLRRWMNVARQWSRRHARLGLIALTRRPGRVYASETHLDIAFDLSQLDVRVRRAALDVDPGWIPWLGRVIQFTYTDSRDRTR